MFIRRLESRRRGCGYFKWKFSMNFYNAKRIIAGETIVAWRSIYCKIIFDAAVAGCERGVRKDFSPIDTLIVWITHYHISFPHFNQPSIFPRHAYEPLNILTRRLSIFLFAYHPTCFIRRPCLMTSYIHTNTTVYNCSIALLLPGTEYTRCKTLRVFSVFSTPKLRCILDATLYKTLAQRHADRI